MDNMLCKAREFEVLGSIIMASLTSYTKLVCIRTDTVCKLSALFESQLLKTAKMNKYSSNICLFIHKVNHVSHWDIFYSLSLDSIYGLLKFSGKYVNSTAHWQEILPSKKSYLIIENICFSGINLLFRLK